MTTIEQNSQSNGQPREHAFDQSGGAAQIKGIFHMTEQRTAVLSQ